VSPSWITGSNLINPYKNETIHAKFVNFMSVNAKMCCGQFAYKQSIGASIILFIFQFFTYITVNCLVDACSLNLMSSFLHAFSSFDLYTIVIC
jgi:hypothetical protein